MRRRTRFTAFFASLILLTAGAFLHAQENFWEKPVVVIPRGVKFSQAAVGGNLMVIGWQEMTMKSAGQGAISLSLAVSVDGKNWTQRGSVYGPIPFSQPESGLYPPVYSLAVDAGGRIFIAAAVAEKKIAVIVSDDRGASFREATVLQTEYPAVTPYIAVTARGGFLLFVTESSGGSREGVAAAEQYLSIYSSSSSDGTDWSPFVPFVTETDLRYNFTPAYASLNGKDYVVFQSRSVKNTFQLYLKTSADGGKTWGKAVDITGAKDFNETVSGKLYDAVSFMNQRPNLRSVDGRMGLAWERNLPGAKAQVHFAEINEAGKIIRAAEKASKDAKDSETLYGRVVEYKGKPYVMYSSTAQNRINLAPVDDLADAVQLNKDAQGRTPAGVHSSPHAVELRGQLYIFWETTDSGNVAVSEVRPDTEANPPRLLAVDFKPGRRSNKSGITVQWNVPEDPAGISGFRYTWGLSGKEKFAGTIQAPNPLLKLSAETDGLWELSVASEDYAGNISEPSSLTFIRDTTPPPSVTIAGMETDAEGYLVSNTFSVTWEEPAGETVSRYDYGVKYLGADPKAAEGGAGVVPMREETAVRKVSYTDHDDGVYAFAVSAVDEAGNVGEPAVLVLMLNKYVPYTAIGKVTWTTDEFGDRTLSIPGRGFTAQGTVDRIYLGREAKPPYDYEFIRSEGDFEVKGDRLIIGPKLDSQVDQGDYLLIIHHPARLNTVWKDGMIEWTPPGVIKLGPNMAFRYLPRWITDKVPLYSIPFEGVLVVIVTALVAFFIIVSSRRMASFVREGAMLREEVTALIERRSSAFWVERKREMQELRRKGMGLRLKYTMLMVVLVILIILIVSIPLSYQMIGRQQATLADGLKQRSELLIGSLAASAENQLALYYQESTTAVADMGLVPDSISAMGEEALWATITGPGDKDRQNKDYIWATNDAEWIAAHADYVPGTEKPTDDVSLLTPAVVSEIEEAAGSKIAPLLKENDKNLTLYNTLIQKTDKKSQAEAYDALDAYYTGKRSVDSAMKALSEISWIRSVPEFQTGSLKPLYVFYKPIVFSNRQKDAAGNNLRDKNGDYIYSFFQGMVRLEVSTRIIQKQIVDARNTLIRNTGLIALIAVGLGILGAIILANITVTPIKKLAAGVAIIRDTEDKKDLGSHVIEVHTRDEIGMLADTVNDMTKGLVKAAIASEELMVGKDVQKMFLPLEKDTENRKGTTGGEDNPRIEIFGYYEGAKGVSGDYFDFKRLDDTHYALIKCDVAGKGVPAALIMVEVATLFINYFRDWIKHKEELPRLKDPAEKKKHSEDLARVDTLVYTINDMIEERGFKGRFAALTICLLNSETGAVTVCNAGDKEFHVFEASTGKMTIRELPSAPAAGVFPSMLVDMKTGFKQIGHTLHAGDALFLFTDGFVESNRTFRDAAFREIACDEPGLKMDEDHNGTHGKGDTSEEFGIKRIHAIVDAVFSKGRYVLVKNHDPTPGDELAFDFSSCAGTAREAVLALVAVEKVFRLFRSPAAGALSKVVLDAKVNEFMKSHFVPYGRFFDHPQENQAAEGPATFTHLNEDDQYDDLTIIVVRKK